MSKHQRFFLAKASVIVAFLLHVFIANAQFGPPLPPLPPLVISEFRLRGPAGPLDEFIEISNNSNKAHTVAAAIGLGYALVGSDGLARCVIPNGTVIPARGHFLCVNEGGYSLGSYPAGDGTARGDVNYIRNIPDNAGIALFNSSNAHGFTPANRIDAVGSNTEANVLYKEGTGYPALTPFSVNFSLSRDLCGKDATIASLFTCTTGGFAIDTNDNADDFVCVDTNGTSLGAGQHLGAPGPENLSSPVYRGPGTEIARTLLDPLANLSSVPNRLRDSTPDLFVNATFGKVAFRRTFTNNSNFPITHLRLRFIDLTTFPAPGGIADLRVISSADRYVTTNNGLRLVRGTTLDEPPLQPNGGGLNTSISTPAVSTTEPLLPGASIDLRFDFGVQHTGAFRFAVVIETLPARRSNVWVVSGDTETRNDIEE